MISPRRDSFRASESRHPTVSQAQEACTRLSDGNARFAAGQTPQPIPKGRRAELSQGQSPFAIILSCSDSRVAPEAVFDQPLGELFVVRVAGNIAGPSQVASIEYAVENFGCPLVLVLGHTNCGAIRAMLESLDTGDTPQSLVCLFDELCPAAESISSDAPDRINEVAEAHVRATVAKLLNTSSTIRARVSSGNLGVQAALYSLATGEVAFLDETP